MDHMGIVLHHHHLVDRDRAVGADLAEVVPLEVEEHDMLGPLLFVRQQFDGQLRGLGAVPAPPARARDRPRVGLSCQPAAPAAPARN